MSVEAVFFDIDGTLVDSNEFHVMAWEQAFCESGYPASGEAIRKQIGKGADTLIPSLMPYSDEKTRQAIAKRHGQIFQSQYLLQVKPFSGAKQLIERLHRGHRKILLASSAKATEVQHYMKLLGVESLLHATTSADDVKHSKPAADIFASALAKVAPVPASEIFAVGDTPYDALAAGKCGIKTIALLSGGFSKRELEDAGAIAVYSSVHDLLANLEISPLARRIDR
jgi:phosphoglycolate phosphatase-like HAD superfamily hydrolase